MEVQNTTVPAILTQSGDPFADVGAAVLRKLLAQNPEWTLKQVLHFATDVYVQSWQGKLHAFFLNSGITNPSNKGKETERTLEYYEPLLEDAAAAGTGWCRVSGRNEVLLPAGRENQILAGSGTFLNFNHGLEQGLRVGRSTLLHLYFAPLGCIEVGGNPALVHSSQPDVTALLAAKNLKENLRPTNAELKPGLAKSTRSNAANTLFRFVDDILLEVEKASLQLPAGPAPALTLYNFTNFGAKPDVTLHHLSAWVFDFYRQVMSVFKEPWTWFVRAHYRHSKFRSARARPDSTALLVPGKPNEAPAVVEPAVYQAWPNSVYLRLIQGQSLLPLMRAWARHQPFPFELTAFYCQYLLAMDRKTLDLIAHVARYVATETDDSAIKRTLTRLSTARTGSEVRLLLVGLQRRNYETNQQTTEPLLRLEDYVRYLFPDGTSWREIRDLLLISLYEQLHLSNRHVELEEGLEEVGAGSDEHEQDTDQE
ncbi:type I-B CRISPR-associated protein Cas8b1/Cst1 [Hymenobacter weizhouensis]|uniref:type I-B CRISPR-associated protein Cas8b1/Cst1 n=1 Tax=Hymenobacter sp. YIM 151500-1 TaxID=2987689 RepID=UPI002227E5DA|nr:type I-B CRISPR-associated protein Cas8b1/Cst1 [Hymenobacter sp. YIM 151500-1]UYZ64063.1 type I-B CRISPR-associated protein Cas8b1/Cst1 [Hymenobacter sp. YIM 151500-1]